MPRSKLRLAVGALVLSVTVASAAQSSARACYTPNGDNRNAQFNYTDGYSYAPCNNVAKHSMCCVIGYGETEARQDTCTPDGLCFNEGQNQYWRESCTDPTWKDPACIKLFVNGTGFNGSEIDSDGTRPLADVTVTPCGDGSYCYGMHDEAQGCCAAKQGVFILNGAQVTTNPNATKTNSTTGASGSASAAPQGSDGLSSGAGIGIGVAIGLVVASVLFGLGHARSRWAKRRRGHPTYPNADKENTQFMLDSKPVSTPATSVPDEPLIHRTELP